MKKWLYKLIFSIAIVPLILFMLPKKQVKAQQQEDFPLYMIKTTWVATNHAKTNSYTYEFIVTYKIDGVFINNLDIGEYVLIPTISISLLQGYYDEYTNTMSLANIQIEDNSTIFYVKVTIGKTRVDNNYGGPANINEFFVNESAFYVCAMYDDIAGQAYNEGYDEGYDDGWELGYQEGHTNGYIEGYDVGAEYGYDVGLEHGYENGYNEGHYDGYDEGYMLGRDEGYNNGYNAGYNVGEIDGIMKDMMKDMMKDIRKEKNMA